MHELCPSQIPTKMPRAWSVLKELSKDALRTADSKAFFLSPLLPLGSLSNTPIKIGRFQRVTIGEGHGTLEPSEAAV